MTGPPSECWVPHTSWNNKTKQRLFQHYDACFTLGHSYILPAQIKAKRNFLSKADYVSSQKHWTLRNSILVVLSLPNYFLHHSIHSVTSSRCIFRRNGRYQLVKMTSSLNLEIFVPGSLLHLWSVCKILRCAKYTGIFPYGMGLYTTLWHKKYCLNPSQAQHQ